MMDNGNLDNIAPTDSSAVDVPHVLDVIRNAGALCMLVGPGSMVCGALTLIYAFPVLGFPFVTASGVWAGACALLMGGLIYYFTRIYDYSPPSAAIKWVNRYRMFGHLACPVGGLHFGFSVACLTTCMTRAKNDDGMQVCNLDNHDSLVILSGFGIAFGAMIICLGLFSIIYVLSGRRGAALTGNPNYGKCGQCNSI